MVSGPAAAAFVDKSVCRRTGSSRIGVARTGRVSRVKGVEVFGRIAQQRRVQRMAASNYSWLQAVRGLALSGCSAMALMAMITDASLSSAAAETLRDALAAAYKNNPRLDAARAGLRAQDEDIARAHSGYRPTITGSADIGYERRDTKPQSPGDGETHPKGYGFNASQPIFSGFRTLNNVREAEASVRAGRETLRSVEQEILLQAITAYRDDVRSARQIKGGIALSPAGLMVGPSPNSSPNPGPDPGSAPT